MSRGGLGLLAVAVALSTGCATDLETGSGDGADIDTTAEILAELEANGFCDPADVSGTGDVGDATVMRFVVGGVPQPPCFGDPDDRLDRAWNDLVDIAPAEYVGAISLVAGYEACEGCDTLAFVSSLDEDGAFFLMAIDVTAEQDDPDGLLLTLMHELSHVVTQDPVAQLAVDVPAAECRTYHTGNGCLLADSYMWEWIGRFWPDADLADVVDGEPDEEAGASRCDLDPSYTGPYGASSPEEDFAEVMAAYVFDVDVHPALDDKLAFLDARPEFRQIRDRAAELGLSGLPGDFEGCG